MTPRKKTKEDEGHALISLPLERIFELIDERVQSRGQHELGVVDDSAEIARLASAARKHGATMPELADRVKRMDKRERVLKPISRQAMDIILATFEQRREPRTTRASRRRRRRKPAGTINTEALK